MIKLRVKLELVLVKDPVRIVRLNKNVNVKVDKGEGAGFERRRGVNVAVELEDFTAGPLKTEDAVPTIRPEELSANGPCLDGADERVSNLLSEESIEDDERVFPPRDASRPTSMKAAVVFARADDNLGHVSQTFL